MQSSSIDFSAIVSESWCAGPLLNRVKWELYLPAHRHEFITRKLSEMARCRREALQARDSPHLVATSASRKAPERLSHHSTSAPTSPQAPPPNMVVALRGYRPNGVTAASVAEPPSEGGVRDAIR